MQRILGLLGLIATVMHIALGCCAHPGHDSAESHDHGPHVFATACTGHHHHHEHEHESVPVATTYGEQIALPHSAGHQCHDDDHCTSTLTLKVAFEPTLFGTALFAVLLQPAESVARPTLSTHLDIDPHAFSGLRAHALCARFLI